MIGEPQAKCTSECRRIMILTAAGDAEVDNLDVATPFGDRRAVVLGRVAAPDGERPLKRDAGRGGAAEPRPGREVAAQRDLGSLKPNSTNGRGDERLTVRRQTGRQDDGSAIDAFDLANVNGREARDGDVADAPPVGFRVGRDIRPATAKVDARWRASNDRSRHGALNCGYAT